jgi:transglutaminase-like putative cysteine protease
VNGRGIAAVAILAAWGAGIAVLAQREMSRSPRELLAEASVRIAPTATWLAVSREGRQVGFASFTIDTVPDGLQFTDYVVEDVAAGERVRRDVRQVVVHASRTLGVREIVVSRNGPAGTARVLDDSTVAVYTLDGGRTDTTHLRYAPPLLVPMLVPLAVALGEPPSAGDRHAFDVLDPATLTVRRLTVTVRAESTWVVVDSAGYDGSSRRWSGVHVDTVQAWRVVEDGAGGVDAWVDDLGQPVAARSGDASLRRTAYEVAFENWRTSSRAGDATAAPAEALPTLSGVPLVPGSPRVFGLALVVRGLPLDRLSAASEWQTIAGDTLRITAPARSGRPNGYWLPPHRDFRALFVRQLQVEPGIEADEPAIVAASRRVRSRQVDPVVFATSLTRWVADSIRLEPTLSPPSALATLRSRVGDVDHHVHLFVAMARAAGLPARPVRGLLREGDRWLSHAWAEAYLGGQWLPVDPSTGQLPADAAHVRLVVGTLGAREELERLVLRASISLVPSPPRARPTPQHP